MPIKIKSLSTVTTLMFFIIISLFIFPKLNIVNGHTTPDRYSLEPNILLEKTESFPPSISILFSERPDPKVSYIHVTDSEGKRIDNDDFKITGEYDRKGTVTVDKTLIKEAVYSVSWSTLSLDDGHVAKGTYVVGVGNSLQTDTVTKSVTDNNIVYSPILGVLKIPIVIGQVYVLGFAFSQILIWKDIHRQGLRNIIDLILIRRFTIPIIMLSIVMGVAATLIPIFQSSIISETQSEYMKNLTLLYFETTNGLVWLTRIISCAIVAFVTYYYSRVVTNDTNGSSSATSRTKGTILLYFLLISISVFIATNSFTSHSSSVATWSQLGILADFVHSVAVSIWIGGLMYILYVLFPNVIAISKNIIGKVHEVIAQPRSILLLILCRFSVISTICVGVIGITGLSLAWLHIQSMDELLLSEYGRTLILKLSLVLPVVILGAYHQFWISKMVKVLDFERVNEGEPSKTKFSQRLSSLKTTLKIECILAASVLCAASFLTVTTPPGTMQTNEVIKSISNGQMAAMQSEFIRTLETQGIPIRLVISPFVTGFNNFTINIFGNNESMGQVSNVSIEFRKSDLSLGPIFAKLVRNNDTAYSVSGGYLSQAGEWDLKVTIKRFNLYDLNYRVSFPLNKSSDSIDDQHHVDTVEIADTPNRSSSFTPMVIVLSVIASALSTYFCINALNRLKIVQQRLGLRN